MSERAGNNPRRRAGQDLALGPGAMIGRRARLQASDKLRVPSTHNYEIVWHVQWRLRGTTARGLARDRCATAKARFRANMLCRRYQYVPRTVA